jgi:hypothetical protein
MPLPIDFSAAGVDISHDPQWAPSTSSPDRARDQDQQHAISEVDNAQPRISEDRDDVTMEDVVELPRASNSSNCLPPKPSASRRSKRADLDWEVHRAKLHELYIQDGKTLTQTMKTMKDNYGFNAP